MKTTFKNSSVKKQCCKNAFFMFCFPETQQARNLFPEERFLYLNENKTDLATSNYPNRKSHEKISPKQREAWLKPGDFASSYLCLFALEKRALTQSRLYLFIYFLLELHSHCCQILQTRWCLLYLIVFLPQRNKIKQQLSQNTEKKLLYCTHCHTNV